MNLKKHIFRNKITSKKVAVTIFLLFIINTLFVNVMADNYLSTNKDAEPLSSRANEILGLLIGPGTYYGNVDSNTNPIRFYTIRLNGSIGETELISITINTTTGAFGVGAFQLGNPDLFIIDYGFFTRISGRVNIRRRAITSGYHYIGVVAAFGSVPYEMRVTVRKSSNPTNDGNNDFGNCTVAVPEDSFQEILNYSYDYWDLYQITLPPWRNLTVSGEPDNPLDLAMQLYDAKDSSTDHLLMQNDSGFGGIREVLYFETNVSAFTVYIRVYADTWNLETGKYYLNFTTVGVNKGPKINQSDQNMSKWTDDPGITINEDESSVNEINLSEHFMDDGFPEIPGKLTFNYIKSTNNIQVTIAANGLVTFTPVQDWFGSAVVTFLANDSEFNISDDINISVLPVNDPPVVQSVPDQTWTQDVPVSLVLNVTDLEDTEFTFYDNSTLFEVDQENHSIDFTPKNKDVGIYFININVSDGNDNTSVQFKAEIKNVNDPPVFVKIDTKDPIPDGVVEFSTKEDTYFNITVEVMDIDHKIGVEDTLKFRTNSTDPAFAIHSKTGNISFFPLQQHVGTFYATIIVEDPYEGNATQDISIEVINVNDYPTKPTITVLNTSGLTANFSVAEVDDEDGDTLSFNWNFGDNTPAQELGLTTNHTYPKAGNYTVTVTVDDGKGGFSTGNITVFIEGFPEKNKTNGKNDTNGDNKTGNQTFPDTDHDGLNDTWELEQFGNLTYDADDDPDGDGFNNTQEYENKTNPMKDTDRPIEDKPKPEEPDGKGTDTSDLEFYMNIIAILAIVNLALILSLIGFLAMRKKPAAEPTTGRVPQQPAEPFTVPCPECGKSVPGDAMECPFCGEPIELEDEYEEDVPGRTRRPRAPKEREPVDEYEEGGEEEEWEDEEYYDEEEPEEEWEAAEDEFEVEEGEEFEDELEYYDEDEGYEDEYYDEDEGYDEGYDEEYDEGYDDEYYDEGEEGDYYEDDEYYDDEYYDEEPRPRGRRR